MTTILTNGKYIIADHRLTETIGHSERELDIRTGGKDRLMTLSDRRIKIHRFDNRINVFHPNNKENRAVAFGMAGASVEIDKVNELMKFSSIHTVTVRELGKKIIDICNPRAVFGLLILFESGDSITVTFSPIGKTSKMEIKLFPKGKFVSIGSGSAIHKALADLIPKNMTLEEMFILSCGSDKHTSPSYSVYGVKEDILYAVVQLEPDEAKRRFKEIITTRLNYSSQRVRVHANVFKDE